MSEVDKNHARPPSLTPRLYLANILSYLRKVLGGDRFSNLYKAIVLEIKRLDGLQNRNINLLDYGCGSMELSSQLKNDNIITNYLGVDVFPAPLSKDSSADSKWKNYKRISVDDDFNLDIKYDISIVVDVLHHASNDEKLKILSSLSTTSGYILVKDHFEYGYISRQILRLVDWFGNYAYGINIPKSYFNRKNWEHLVDIAGLQQVSIVPEIRIHDGLFGWLISPKYHFISILIKKNKSV